MLNLAEINHFDSRVVAGNDEPVLIRIEGEVSGIISQRLKQYFRFETITGESSCNVCRLDF
jgi:hypothetical protein